MLKTGNFATNVQHFDTDTKSYLFLVKGRSLFVKQFNKPYGSKSVNFVNTANCKLWLQLRSKLMAAMNTGLNLYLAEYRID